MTARPPLPLPEEVANELSFALVLERERRIQMIGEFTEAMLASRRPNRAALLFVCGALQAWLQQGGSLERDFFRVTKPKSHHTPAHIWQQIVAHQDERQDQSAGGNFPRNQSREEGN